MISETTPYFNAITDARSMRVRDHEAFASETISLETQPDLARDTVGESIQAHFGDLLPHIRLLGLEDQELLLSYFLLGKPQWCLARLYQSTQTICSQRLRLALKKLGLLTRHAGHPDQRALDVVLNEHSLNDIVPGVKTSVLVVEYRARRSFMAVADALRIHRPAVRRALTQAAHSLLAAPHPEHKAVGAYIHGLVDKASIQGQGVNQRKAEALAHVYKADPELVGAFHINLGDTAFDEHVLVSRAAN